MNEQSQFSQLQQQHIRKAFSDNIQNWLLYEQQLKIITERTKQIRELKQLTTKEIYKYMQQNNITTNKIDITGGQLSTYEKKEYSPLTFSYIEECLAKIIPEKSHVDYIINYLKENREIKTTQEIRRTTKNK